MPSRLFIFCLTFSAFVALLPQYAQAQGAQTFWDSLPNPQPAPSILWQTEEGTQQSLADLKGYVVVLNVWATYCKPCFIEMPTLDRLERRYKRAGLRVIPVALDTAGFPKMRQFYRMARIKHLPLFADPGGILMGPLATERLPTTYVINRKGELVAMLEGAEDWFSDAARQNIEALLKEPGGVSAPPEILEDTRSILDVMR